MRSKDNHVLDRACFIRLHWVSLAGVLLAVVIPKERYLAILDGNPSTYTLTSGNFNNPLAAELDTGLAEFASVLLRPDPGSLRAVGQTDGYHASVMCFLDPEGSVPGLLPGWRGCPRRLAVQTVHELERQVPCEIKIGFEIEMVFLDNNGTVPTPTDRIGRLFSLGGLRADRLDHVHEVVEALGQAGIPVWSFHAEDRDQLELALAPLPAVQALDALVLARETIRAVFMKHGIVAALMPKPVDAAGAALNGCHMHLSLNPTDPKLVVKEGRFAPFLAGILDKLPALAALAMPTVDSYGRVSLGAAGRLVGWGYKNRFLPVRAITANRWEFRMSDALVDPYLYLAALLQAGLRGLREEMPLRHKNCQLRENKAEPAQLAEFGITERLPASLEESLGVLGADTLFREVLGTGLVDEFVKLRGRDMEAMKDLSFDERKQIYLEHF